MRENMQGWSKWEWDYRERAHNYHKNYFIHSLSIENSAKLFCELHTYVHVEKSSVSKTEEKTVGWDGNLREIHITLIILNLCCATLPVSSFPYTLFSN